MPLKKETKLNQTKPNKIGKDAHSCKYLVFLFNGISTFLGYLMPKPFSLKKSNGTI